MTQPNSPFSPMQQAWKRLRQRAGAEWAAWARWAQNLLSRENLAAAARTLAWLGPLTVMIWIWAEREQVYTTPLPEAIPIEVRTSIPNRFVELRMPDKNIVAQLSGPRGRVEEVRQRIAPRGDASGVEILIDQNLSAGQTHEFNISELLSRQPVFARRGVSVANCKPDKIRVYVDEYASRELEVQVPPSVTNLVSPPIFDPRRVKLTAPRNFVVDAEARGPLVAYADLAASGVLDKPGPHDLNARVYCPALPRDNVQLEPISIKVTIEVRQSDVKYTIPSMAIYVAGPRYLLEQYRIECADTIANVTVIGPPDRIADLQREDAPKPWAVLQVTGEDRPIAGARPPRRLRFEGLADGVRVSPEDAQRTIEFKLVEKLPEQ